MDNMFLEKMKFRLETLRIELIATLYSENEEFRELLESNDVKDLADCASFDFDTTFIAFKTLSDYKRLNLITSALSRLKNGSYGYCLKSGKEIPRERLEAVPYALFSKEVQEEIDLRKRRSATCM